MGSNGNFQIPVELFYNSIDAIKVEVSNYICCQIKTIYFLTAQLYNWILRVMSGVKLEGMQRFE